MATARLSAWSFWEDEGEAETEAEVEKEVEVEVEVMVGLTSFLKGGMRLLASPEPFFSFPSSLLRSPSFSPSSPLRLGGSLVTATSLLYHPPPLPPPYPLLVFVVVVVLLLLLLLLLLTFVVHEDLPEEWEAKGACFFPNLSSLSLLVPHLRSGWANKVGPGPGQAKTIF